MDVAYENGAALVRTGCFEPRHIFENGQAFRFFPCGANAYEGVAHGRYLRVEKVPEGARLYPCTQQDFERVWKRYFDLERDYAALFSDCGDSVLKQGMQYGCGLRLLNQEPFETLISFIVSANNHVKRIRGILRRICALYGEPFSFEGKTWHRFPAPAILAGLSEEALGECGSGYRAPYIKGAARMAAEGFSLEALRGMGYADAKKELQRLPGVGPKVADCVRCSPLASTMRSRPMYGSGGCCVSNMDLQGTTGKFMSSRGNALGRTRGLRSNTCFSGSGKTAKADFV